MTELTHASFFSGVGGIDIAFERAGWRTVAHSEIAAYPAAMLAERWPGVPNLGDITLIDPHASADWQQASLWTGGFPCQDLSVAGQRKGFEGDRSVLAFAFLDLVEIHQPKAILLENVPGLLTSRNGLDFARLLGEMAQLGYGVAYRVLDAQFFGVPQRRRRVFILGLRSDPDDPDGRIAAERAGEVLSVDSRCERHPAKGGKARSETPSTTVVGTLSIGGHVGLQPNGQDAYTGHVIPVGSAAIDPSGVREASGIAGRVDGSPELAATLRASDGHHGHSSPRGDGSDTLVVAPTLRVGPQRIEDGGPGDTVPIIAATLNSNKGGGWRYDADQAENLVPVPFVKAGRAQSTEAGETWVEGEVMPTLNSFDVGDVRTTAAIVMPPHVLPDDADPLLPLGLDSNRYRAIGNAVAVPVVEWIAHRLTHYFSDTQPVTTTPETEVEEEAIPWL